MNDIMKQGIYSKGRKALNPKKMLIKLLENSKNVGFNDMVMLLECDSFYLARVSGSHHIFVNPD